MFLVLATFFSLFWNELVTKKIVFKRQVVIVEQVSVIIDNMLHVLYGEVCDIFGAGKRATKTADQGSLRIDRNPFYGFSLDEMFTDHPRLMCFGLLL
jgi:hypothetical protein